MSVINIGIKNELLSDTKQKGKTVREIKTFDDLQVFVSDEIGGIVDSINNNNMSGLEKSLINGENPNVFVGLNSPLTIAALKKNIPALDLLYAHHADVNLPNRDGRTAFYSAVMSGDRDVFKWFLNHNADIFVQGDRGETVLEAAILSGHLDFAETLIEKGLSVNIKNYKGQSLLWSAIQSNNADTFYFLLEKGIDISAKDNLGNTPLHAAASYNKPWSVHLLMQKGFDINVKNNLGETPIQIAVKSKNCDVLKYLAKHDADIHVCDAEGNTLMHLAAQEGNITLLEYLYELGLDVNAKNNKGETALMKAIQADKYHNVSFLLQNGADFTMTDHAGNTPKEVALLSNNVKVLNLLENVEKDAAYFNNNRLYLHIEQLIRQGQVESVKTLLGSVNYAKLSDTNKTTLLHTAAYSNNVEIMKLLISHGADINARDSYNETPLTSAIKGCANNAFHLLLSHPDIEKDACLLHVAAAAKNIGAAKHLIKMGYDVNAYDSRMSTPLKEAAKSNAIKMGGFLLQEGALPNKADDAGHTPLHIVALNGNVVFANMLLNSGADIDVKSNFGRTPLWSACNSGQVPMLCFLLEKGANPNERDTQGHILISSVYARQDYNLFKALVESGKCYLDVKDKFGSSVLEKAVFQNKAPYVKLLLENGAKAKTYIDFIVGKEPNGMIKTMKMPIVYHAASKNNADVLKLLMKHDGVPYQTNMPLLMWYALRARQSYEAFQALLDSGLSINEQNPQGYTVLHYAARNILYDGVKKAIEAGADVSLKTANGLTALDIAESKYEGFKEKIAIADARDPKRKKSKLDFYANQARKVATYLRIVAEKQKMLQEKSGNTQAKQVSYAAIMSNAENTR